MGSRLRFGEGELELPSRLAKLHLDHRVGDVIDVAVPMSPHRDLIVEGAGFEMVEASDADVTLRRLHTLADRVGPNMAVLICGLNPSPSSADSGIGFHRAGNRFWPAALAAGLATIDRDPGHALAHHGMGMTDIVKRTTRRADEISTAEFRGGMARIEALCQWLQPGSVIMVGLAGWRAGVDRRAERGWQHGDVGGSPVYLMASTSGLNAHDTVDTLTAHLRAGRAGPASSP